MNFRTLAISGLLVALGAWLFFKITNLACDGHQLSTGEIIQVYGYPYEVHKILTEDGYILTVFRIPHKKDEKPGPRPVFLLQHGLFGTSDQFVHLGPEKSMGFFLVDKGFDVWIGNIRGNHYCQENIHYNNTDPKFWDFSWDEMGYFDLSATISYILKNTNQTKVYYAGHSMGSNMLMVLLTRRPEFQNKIELGFGLAPAVFVKHSRSNVFVAFCAYYAPFALRIFGPSQILPAFFKNFITWVSSNCDPENQATWKICRLIYTVSQGPSTDFDQNTLSAYFSTNPSQASAKSLAHYGQGIESGKFIPYDYGVEENFKRYGLAEPPLFNLSEVQTPVAIIYSDSDYIVPPSDAQMLCLSLPRVTAFHRIALTTFNHMDFLYGLSARKLLHEEMFKIIKRGISNEKENINCEINELN